jgi:hypothetical protein
MFWTALSTKVVTIDCQKAGESLATPSTALSVGDQDSRIWGINLFPESIGDQQVNLTWHDDTKIVQDNPLDVTITRWSHELSRSKK